MNEDRAGEATASPLNPGALVRPATVPNTSRDGDTVARSGKRQFEIPIRLSMECDR
jgi:hypothetical protein